MNLRRTLAAMLGALVGALFATLGVGLLAPSPAYACSCDAVGPAVLVERADTVLVGEFASRRNIEPEPDEHGVVSSGDLRTEYDLRVDEVLVGDPVTAATIHSTGDSAACGVDAAELDMPWVVFASREGDELHIGLCGGSGPVAHAPMEEIRAAAGGEPGPTTEVTEQGVTEPAPPIPTRVQAGTAEGEPATSGSESVGSWVGGGLVLLGVAGAGVWVFRHRNSLIPRQR